MIKMTTLFRVDYHAKGTPGVIYNEVRPENSWVFTDNGVVAYRKRDGSAALVKDGKLYKRYDAKKGKTIPEGAIPCQEPDPISGHHPHWVLCQLNNPADKYFLEAFNGNEADGTYELCGEKINTNSEHLVGHCLISHTSEPLEVEFSFEGIKEFLSNPSNDVEGIVFHHPDGRMCKIRKSDFGVMR